MRLKFSPNLLLSVLAFSLLAISAVDVGAQEVEKKDYANRFEVAVDSPKKTAEPAPAVKPETTETKITALEQMLVEQSQRLDRLQQTIAEQQETIRLLADKLNLTGTPATATAPAAATGAVVPQTAKSPTVDDRLKNVEARVS